MISAATMMALVRGLHLAATLSLLGTASFLTWMLTAVSVVPDRLQRRLERSLWVSGLIAFLAGAAWSTIQSAAIAGVDSLSDVMNGLPVVAEHTRYGNVVLARLGLLLLSTLAALISGRATPVLLNLTLILAAIALSLQGLTGHAGARGGAIGDGLVLSESFHLFAAGIWLGALIPLWLSLRALAPAQAASVTSQAPASPDVAKLDEPPAGQPGPATPGSRVPHTRRFARPSASSIPSSSHPCKIHCRKFAPINTQPQTGRLSPTPGRGTIRPTAKEAP